MNMKSVSIFSLSVILLATSCSPQAYRDRLTDNERARVTINPMALNYQFQNSAPSRREATDPVCEYFGGKYYLSASKSISFTASAQSIKVACMGNSITFGAGIDREEDKYPSQLRRLLGEGYEVKNFGQNSQTVQMRGYDLTEGSKPGDCAYRKKETYKNALAYKPDIVVIKLGTNDSKHINWLEDSPEVFRKDLNDMLDEIEANSAPQIFLCYPLRVKKEDWTINEKNVCAIIRILKSVAEERGLYTVDLHSAFEEELGDDWGSVYVDGVHPNAKGAGIMAKRVADAILKSRSVDASCANSRITK